MNKAWIPVFITQVRKWRWYSWLFCHVGPAISSVVLLCACEPSHPGGPASGSEALATATIKAEYSAVAAPLTGYASPLFKPPELIHVVTGSATCSPPLFVNLAPNWPGQFRWVARSWDGRAMRGYIRRLKDGSGYDDFGREWGYDDPLAPDDSTGLPSCTGPSWSQSAQAAATDCNWKPSFPWVSTAQSVPGYAKVDLLQPLADAARVSDIVMVHDVLDYVLFKPGPSCASLHSTGFPYGLSFPSRSALLPSLSGAPGLSPSTGCVDPSGNLHVLVQGGTRIANVGAMGVDPPVFLDLKGIDGGVVPVADRPERIGFSTVGHLLGANRSGLVRIHKKKGTVVRLMDWGPPPLPEFGPGGTAIATDIVHISDPLGAGAWLVSPAGRPEIWVLDDTTLQVKTKWSIGKVDGKPALAVRQLRAILSTGWVYAVVQVAAEPDYDARIVLWKYPLWNGVDEVAAP